MVCRLIIASLLDGLEGALVQGYFAYRIQILSGKWTVTVVSWILSFLAVVGSLTTIVLAQTSTVLDLPARYLILGTVTVVLLVLVDLINTLALCAYLKIGKTGYKNTDHMLNKLFLWTIRKFWFGPFPLPWMILEYRNWNLNKYLWINNVDFIVSYARELSVQSIALHHRFLHANGLI